MPLGLGIKQLVSAPSTLAPLVEWRTDHGLSIVSGDNTWLSLQPLNVYQLKSVDTHLLALTPAWQNGQNGVGFPYHNAGLAVATGNDPFVSQTDPPLSGNDLTIYLVMDFHTFGNPPAPHSTGPIPIFQIGERNESSGAWPQFILAVDNSSAPGSISLFDRDTAGAHEYADAFDQSGIGSPPYLIGPTVVVVQTQRNSGHNVIFGGVTLVPSPILDTGGVPALTTDTMYVCGEEYLDFALNLDCDECGCTLGDILVFNEYHDAATIAVVTAQLNAFWGL